MKEPSKIRPYFGSIAISALVNAFLLSSAFVTSAGGNKSPYVRLANLVAAPPGYVASRMFAPKEHSSIAFMAVAVASLAFSFLFYAVVSWLILRTWLLLIMASSNSLNLPQRSQFRQVRSKL